VYSLDHKCKTCDRCVVEMRPSGIARAYCSDLKQPHMAPNYWLITRAGQTWDGYAENPTTAIENVNRILDKFGVKPHCPKITANDSVHHRYELPELKRRLNRE